jgi:hypothetical protein
MPLALVFYKFHLGGNGKREKTKNNAAKKVSEY